MSPLHTFANDKMIFYIDMSYVRWKNPDIDSQNAIAAHSEH